MDERLAIKVENLSKVYQLRQPRVNEEGKLVTEHWALKEVSFEIKKGESVGIIGPNGSGKSTLLKILAGVTKPSSGSVQIRGKVASILDIGAGFHPELSGRENVFLNGQIHGFTKKNINQKFKKIVSFSGIEEFIDEPVKNYSQGMYLRLAFSIMVHLDFDVYLLDEVLGVGDEEFQNKGVEKIKELKEKEKTLLIIYHNFVISKQIVEREIDISKFGLNKRFKDIEFDKYDEVLYINGGLLESINIPIYCLRDNRVQLSISIKSSTGVVLAISNFININKQNFKEHVITLSLKLDLLKGVYLLEAFIVKDSNYQFIHSKKLIVQSNSSKVSKAFSTLNSSLLFNVEKV